MFDLGALIATLTPFVGARVIGGFGRYRSNSKKNADWYKVSG